MADYLIILNKSKPDLMKTTLKISLFALTFAGLFTACKTTENVATTVVETSPQSELASEAPAVENVTPPVSKADSTARVFFASIIRTPCYGNCPTYDMTIYQDGFVELNGIRGIDFTGKYTTQLNEAEVHNFRIRANRIEFMDMDDKYDGMITDLPSATTTIVLNGVKKSVYRRYNYPPRILQLEELFDELLKSKKWKAVVKAEQD